MMENRYFWLLSTLVFILVFITPPATAAQHAGNTDENTKANTTQGSGEVGASKIHSTTKAQIVEGLETISASLTEKLYALNLKSIAVPDLRENGPESQKYALGKTSAVELIRLMKDARFNVIERDRLLEILKEIELGQTGVIDEAKAVEIGRMANVQSFLFGSVSDAGAYFIINIRVVNTETAEIIASESVQIAHASMVALSSESVVLKSRADAFYRSLLPGWGQVYNEQPVKAGIFIGAEAAAIAATLTLHFLSEEKADDYDACITPGKCKPLRDDANELKLWRNVCIGLTVGVWVVGIIDAVVSAKTYKRMPDGSIQQVRLDGSDRDGASVSVSGFSVADDPFGGGLNLQINY